MGYTYSYTLAHTTSQVRKVFWVGFSLLPCIKVVQYANMTST